MEHTRAEIVSFDSEPLILVDADDQPIGELDKAACHAGEGVLHRAFSLFVFNEQNQLLIQQRAAGKRLWGGYWSNSCCSHPRVGEEIQDAVSRRCREELGFDVEPRFMFKFQYAARFEDRGSERELCSVYLARFLGEPLINIEELQDFRWVNLDAVAPMLDDSELKTTPWFTLEWQRLLDNLPQSIPSAGTRR